MQKHRIDEEIGVINLFDERWYQIPDQKDSGKTIDVPGVTTYLEAFPKGYAFKQWMRSVGFNDIEVMRRAGEFGSRFHDLVERALHGETLLYDEYKDIDLWKRFMVWFSFWKTLKTTANVSYNDSWIETIVYDHENLYGGRRDFRMTINGKNIAVDWKSGNYVGDEAQMQIAAYAIAEEKMIRKTDPDFMIHEGWICWFPTKKPNKAGYRIIKRTRQEMMIDFEDFKHVQATWRREHKNERPRYKTLPLKINIKDISGSSLNKGGK